MTATSEPATSPPSTVVHPAAAPWFGRPWEHRQLAVATVGSLAAGVAYVLACRTFAPDLTPGWLEFTATVSSLMSVWVTRRQNVLALPVGIVSVVLMGALFWQIGLVGQTALHLAYYLPVQVYGWWAWTRGGPRRTELGTSRIAAQTRWLLVPGLVLATLLFGWLLDAGWDRAVFTYWDASIVAASVTAQWLLTRKKVESWWLWIVPVDVSAIALYALTGATMFAALYVVFLGLATAGLVQWSRQHRRSLVEGGS